MVVLQTNPLLANDVVHLNRGAVSKGRAGSDSDRAFSGFDAVFERYLSGAERVAILLNAVEGYSLRIIAKARSIAR